MLAFYLRCHQKLFLLPPLTCSVDHLCPLIWAVLDLFLVSEVSSGHAASFHHSSHSAPPGLGFQDLKNYKKSFLHLFDEELFRGHVDNLLYNFLLIHSTGQTNRKRGDYISFLGDEGCQGVLCLSPYLEWSCIFS